jgi:hypothetical protein
VDPRTKIQQQYAYFKSAIYERRIEIYEKCDLLTEEILQLERLGNGKIEHEDAGKHGSKDQCDAFCGSLWSASRFAEEYSYSYGDNLVTALDANDTTGAEVMTGLGTPTTTTAVTDIGTGTAAAQQITVGNNDEVDVAKYSDLSLSVTKGNH